MTSETMSEKNIEYVEVTFSDQRWSRPIHKGWMHLLQASSKIKWKRVFFILNASGELWHFKNEKSKKPMKKKCTQVNGFRFRETIAHEFCIEIETEKEEKVPFMFFGNNREEVILWMKKLLFAGGIVEDFSSISCFLLSGSILINKLNKEMRRRQNEFTEEEEEEEIEIDRSEFKIPFDDIDLKVIVDISGCNGVILAGEYKKEQQKKNILFLCFKTKDVSTRKKLKLLTDSMNQMMKLDHPNLLKFIGGTIKPPRIGIIIENNLSNNESPEDFETVEDYIRKKKKQKKKKSSEEVEGEEEEKEKEDCCSSSLFSPQKLKILDGVAYSMSYLHEYKINHGGLSWKSFLISEKDPGVPKLIDIVGITSKFSRESDKFRWLKKSNNYFYSPEMTLRYPWDNTTSSISSYDDVYCFGIMMYQLITGEIDNIFGEEEEETKKTKKHQHSLAMRIALDERFRPDIDNWVSNYYSEAGREEEEKESIGWLVELMKRCWAEKKEDRPNFYEIKGIFDEKKKIN